MRKVSKRLKNEENGIFIISFDMELYWGVRDEISLKKYKKNLIGVHSFIPSILKLFKRFDIHSTWAIVGFLFFKSKEHLISNIPSKLPNYSNKNYSPYDYAFKMKANKFKDLYHFAPNLIELINSYPNQEIATHTFSHFYCLEKSQNLESFKLDLETAVNIAQKNKILIKSITFPRNQINPQYFHILKEFGINQYRGNPLSWLYHTETWEKSSFLFRRIFQFLDAYINITGHNTYNIKSISNSILLNIAASRFLYWYTKPIKYLETMKVKRICSDLTYAAKRGEIYHLWAHPHNFGVNISENLKLFRKIIKHYVHLREKYDMKSLNMSELAHYIR
ncbi:MAG: hypothetical protein EU529_04220 [Promethearchaeota archaeon]|nr:MAG: hypothetical protein EU529_04220 [Candidatus Lokiarchaeota archaeon]